MYRFASVFCILSLAAGCGDTTSPSASSETTQMDSKTQTARINIQGFKKSKSGAT